MQDTEVQDITDVRQSENALGPARADRRTVRRRRRRVQLDLLPDVYDRVVELQLANGFDSVRSVFRQAFRLYEWYTTRRSQGWTIQLVHQDGRVAIVDLGLEGERPVIGAVNRERASRR